MFHANDTFLPKTYACNTSWLWESKRAYINRGFFRTRKHLEIFDDTCPKHGVGNNARLSQVKCVIDTIQRTIQDPE